MSIKMTKKAALQVQSVIQSRSLPDTTMLRVGVEAGQGEELRISLSLDPQQPGAEDQVETTEGTRLAIDKELARAIGERELDYREEVGDFVLKSVEPDR